MSLTIVLDATPLSLLSQRQGIMAADTCRSWLAVQLSRGRQVVVPEITDYEVRRELIRAGKTAGAARMDTFISAAPDRYLPLTTVAMRLAARLWAEARNRGIPTADSQALDGDVILAAQVIALGLAPTDVVVATANVGHLSRFVPAMRWQDIA